IAAGPQTISPHSALPGILDPVIIDATTQPGFAGKPIIELKGTNAPGASGFDVGASDSIIRGFVINSFAESGVVIGRYGAVIEGNYIGTDLTGTIRRANGKGVSILSGDDHRVGGLKPESRNIIAGNVGDGIRVGSTGGAIQMNGI